jgi:hypothetical protein
MTETVYASAREVTAGLRKIADAHHQLGREMEIAVAMISTLDNALDEAKLLVSMGRQQEALVKCGISGQRHELRIESLRS